MSAKRFSSDIKRIAVIDDDKAARKTMAEIVTDAHFQPIIHEDQLDSLSDLFSKLNKEADAAIFDHRLTPRNYAAFHGAEAVAELYEKHFPALLITAWSIEDIDNIRPYRRKIPVMIKSREFVADLIESSLVKCLEEFKNKYTRERSPHRVLIRVEDINTQFIYVVIPSWDSQNGLKLPKNILTSKFGKIQPGTRLFAEVNIGALNNEELYLDNFEIADKL
jgi:hypothetical protein